MPNQMLMVETSNSNIDKPDETITKIRVEKPFNIVPLTETSYATADTMDDAQMNLDAAGTTTSSSSSTTPTISSTPPPSIERTVIILDWDDTLLASSWLATRELRLESPRFLEPAHRLELHALELRVVKFLTRAIDLGNVFLVTNAETGWVELSAERFMPGVVELLPKVKIVSARSKYESMFPFQPSQWKIHAFREEIRNALLDAHLDQELGPCNVISIGDSQHEREALHVVTATMDNTLVKSVKFVERPEMDVLRRQIELMHGCIEYIANHAGHLDLMLSQNLLFGNDDEQSITTEWDDIEEIAAAGAF